MQIKKIFKIVKYKTNQIVFLEPRLSYISDQLIHRTGIKVRLSNYISGLSVKND